MQHSVVTSKWYQISIQILGFNFKLNTGFLSRFLSTIKSRLVFKYFVPFSIVGEQITKDICDGSTKKKFGPPSRTNISLISQGCGKIWMKYRNLGLVLLPLSTLLRESFREYSSCKFFKTDVFCVSERRPHTIAHISLGR